MKKVLVMLVLLSVSVFANVNNQTPIKPIKPAAMEKAIEKTSEVNKISEVEKTSSVNLLMEIFKQETSNKLITSHWKAEIFLGVMFLLFALTLVGRTKRKRAVSL
jgi:hypothetical protein